MCADAEAIDPRFGTAGTDGVIQDQDRHRSPVGGKGRVFWSRSACTAVGTPDSINLPYPRPISPDGREKSGPDIHSTKENLESQSRDQDGFD